MTDKTKLILDGGNDNDSPESSGEYIHHVSNAGLNEWKTNFGTDRNTAEAISIKKQITFSWCNINAFGQESDESEENKGILFDIPKKGTKKEQKHILKNVNGVAYPGELLVIMGSSGAGKTTLLNCMTFRNLKNLTVSGLVCINDMAVTQTQLAAESAYVQQDDLFIKFLTVKEHLTFQSKVRMDGSLTDEARKLRVEEVMTELSLKKCEDCIIGEPGIVKGVSGGERKRLALASELLTNPSLLFCDEPTTGLDSFMSLNVVQMLKDLARTGRTVITTLHQPSSELYQMFDKLCLMAEGRTAFLGTTAEANDFFAKLEAPCPQKFNPADHYIQLLAIMPGKEEACKRAVNSVCDVFEVSTLGLNIRKGTEKTVKSAKKTKDLWSRTEGQVNPYKVGWCAQMRAVFWRTWLSIIKNPEATTRKYFLVLMESVLISIIYFGQTLSQAGVKNLDGVYFYLLMSTSFQNLFSALDLFCVERPLFMKEHKDGMYRTDVYYLSKIICTMPITISLACLNSAVCYYLVGLNPAVDRFLMTLLITSLMGQAAAGGGYVVSTISPNLELAAPLIGLAVTPLFLFGGVFLNFSSIPSYLQWLASLSWFKYGYEAYLINQWSDIKYIPCDLNSTSVCINNGLEVLKNNSVTVSEFWPALLALVILCIFYRFVAFCVLYYKASKE